MFRHLAPVTTPLAPITLLRALRSPADVVAQFSKALEEYLDVPGCFLAASGRTAFYLLLKSLQSATDSTARRMVILPAYTCPSLAKVVLDAGLQPCLVDISPITFVYDSVQLAAHLDQQTLAVLIVHPFGIPQAVEPVQELAKQVGAVLIEDAAQAMGAAVDGKLVGTLGDYGLFSLGPGKPLSTGGGGIVCVRDPANAGRVAASWQALSAASTLASVMALARLTAFTMAFHPQGWWLATRAGAHRIGDNEASWAYTLRGLTSAQAAIGLMQLPQLAEYNRQRRAKAEQMIERLREFDFVQIPAAADGNRAQPIYLRLPVLVASAALREELFQQLWAAGIGVGRMYGRTLAEFFPTLANKPYPGAEQIARRLLTLPTHHYVTDPDIARIIQVFRAANDVTL